MTGEGWFSKEISGRHVLMVLSAFFGVMLIAQGFRLRDARQRVDRNLAAATKAA